MIKPFAPFIKLLGLTTAYVVPQEEVERWGRDFSFHGSGTGPYILERWEHNQFLQLRANSSYFKGAPRLGGLIYRIVPEDFTALTEFEAGTIDVMLEIPPAAFRQLRRGPPMEVFCYCGAGAEYLLPGTKLPGRPI